MAKKEYRRFIRIGGKVKRSPKGLSKTQADLWYNRLYEQRETMKGGFYIPTGNGPTLDEYFTETWLPRRKKKKIKSTWSSDIQRYNDYVKPQLGRNRLNKINFMQIRSCLNLITDEHGLSHETRKRVQALLSKIFKDALNENIPLIETNPVSGIRFDDDREGKKEPPHLKKESDIKKYLTAAKELSLNHLTFAVLALGAGLRKSEIAALQWKDWDNEDSILSVNKRLVQAANEIISGTKSGSKEGREIPISDEICSVLYVLKNVSPFHKQNDFILSKKNGKHFGARDIARLNDQICKKSEIEITPHGLRHTFGRLFAKRSGNMKALQTILGHSSMSVTEIYSELSGSQVHELRNVAKLGVKDE